MVTDVCGPHLDKQKLVPECPRQNFPAFPRDIDERRTNFIALAAGGRWQPVVASGSRAGAAKPRRFFAVQARKRPGRQNQKSGKKPRIFPVGGESIETALLCLPKFISLGQHTAQQRTEETKPVRFFGYAQGLG